MPAENRGRHIADAARHGRYRRYDRLDFLKIDIAAHAPVSPDVDSDVYNRLAGRIARAEDFAGTIAWDASKPDGTPRKLTDVSKIHALGWHHRVEIDEGIKRLYDWYLHTL